MLLSTVFSLSVSAASSDTTVYNDEYTVQIYSALKDPGFHNDYFNLGSQTVLPNDNEVQKSDTTAFVHLDYGFWSAFQYHIALDDNSSLMPADKTTKIKLENAYLSAYIWSLNKYVRHVTNIYVGLTYADGTFEYIRDEEAVDVSHSNATYNFSFKYKPEEDVRVVTFFVESFFDEMQAIGSDVTHYYGEWEGDGTYKLSVIEIDEKVGLLKGIGEKLGGIGEDIKGIFSGIAELPSKIWSFIENGLKSLFVPDEDFIVSFKDDMDTMLENKLGAVYQVTDILSNSWDRISSNDKQNIITIPTTTINLPNNNSFSFGGVDVPIVPSGFEFIVDILKGLIGIVCTVLFINGLRRKYDEVLGGGS